MFIPVSNGVIPSGARNLEVRLTRKLMVTGSNYTPAKEIHQHGEEDDEESANDEETRCHKD